MAARGGQASSSNAPALYEWQSDYTRAIPELQGLQRQQSKPLSVAISRASQMDAVRLDNELTNMLLDQLLKAFTLIEPKYLNALRPELCFLLDLLAGERTGVEGSALSFKQRIGWGLGFVLCKYVWGRLENIAVAFRWGDQEEGSVSYKSWRLMQWTENLYRAASFVNFVIFLLQGKYRSLLERLLRSRLVYKRASMPKALNFEYLNRQLVWHEVSELLLFLLPLINVTRIKAFVLKNIPQTYRIHQTTGGSDLVQSPGKADVCNICMRRDMAIPYIAKPCKHMFCYYCLRSHTEQEAGFKCPNCSTVIESMQQWIPALA